MEVFDIIVLILSCITLTMSILFFNSYKLMFGDQRCDEGNGCSGPPGVFSSISSYLFIFTIVMAIINPISKVLFS